MARSEAGGPHMTKQRTLARLIDLEGVTMCEFWVDGCPPVIDTACNKQLWRVPAQLEDDEYIPMVTIRYERERVTGDGVWIYRRTTGPWG